MPLTQIHVFRDGKGTVPLVDWLDGLKRDEHKRWVKCLAHIRMLRDQGHQLRRPVMDYLRDEIYELRPVREKSSSLNYRILFFFTGSNVVVLSHGISKEAEVPNREIELAINRKKLVLANSSRHTAEFEI